MPLKRRNEGGLRVREVERAYCDGVVVEWKGKGKVKEEKGREVL